jgi:deoxycytidine triphosphate deaminase
MALSDQDVRKHRNRRIVIEPFVEKHLTPAGYDLTLGYALLLSAPDGQITEVDYKTYERLKEGGTNPAPPSIEVPGKSDVLVLTKERVHLSGRVLAQVHARSGIAAKGFILNPLTVDPNFGAVHGRLTFRMFNFSDEPATLAINERIATLVLHTVESETLEAPEARSTELNTDKYHHIPHVQRYVSLYLDHYDHKPEDEGQKKFSDALRDLNKFRNKRPSVRKYIIWKESLSWKGAVPFGPLMLFDIAAVLVRIFPSLLTTLSIPIDSLQAPAYFFSVAAVNLSYVAFVKSMSK